MFSFDYDVSESEVRRIAEIIVNYETYPTITYPVIFARQNAPRPTSDYITIDTLGVSPVGRARIIKDTTEYDNNPESPSAYKILQDVEVTLSFIAVGKKSKTLLSRLEMHLTGGNPIIVDSLIEHAGLAPTGKSSQPDTSAFLDSGYEARAAMEVGFHGCIIESNVDLGNIAQVAISDISYEAQSPHGDGDVLWTSSLTTPAP